MMVAMKSRHHVTMAVITPSVYRGELVHSCGEPMQPAQYPMKNMVLTMARFVLPLTFDAERESRIDMTAVMQEAFSYISYAYMTR